jgi:hypothetical protein
VTSTLTFPGVIYPGARATDEAINPKDQLSDFSGATSVNMRSKKRSAFDHQDGSHNGKSYYADCDPSRIF